MKTLKPLFIIFCAICVLFSSCKGDQAATCSDGIQNGTETAVDCGGECEPCPNDYYFEITYGGNTYYMDNDFFQSAHTWYNEFGGWVSRASLFDDDALAIVFYFADSVQNYDVVDELCGNRIYFNSLDGPYPLAIIKHSGWEYSRYTKRRLDTSIYKVDISEVSFLRNENGFFDMDIYAVKGTFVTQIEDENEEYTDAYGSFFLQCSHGNY